MHGLKEWVEVTEGQSIKIASKHHFTQSRQLTSHIPMNIWVIDHTLRTPL